MRLHAVDDAEIDRLGDAAHVGRHIAAGHTMDHRRGGPVDVVAASEGIDEELLFAQVGQQSQL